MKRKDPNYVNFMVNKKDGKKLGKKAKDRLVMITGGFVVFILTFFLYGIVDESGNNPGNPEVRTENRDILAQIEELEEQKKRKEEKMGMITDEIFLGKNTAVDEYAESLIGDLRRRAEQEKMNEEISSREEDARNEEYSGPGSADHIDDLLSHLREENRDKSDLFPGVSAGDNSISSSRIKRAEEKSVGTLFAFSNTQRSARIYNNGRGEVFYNREKNNGENIVGKNRSRSDNSAGELLVFNSNPVFKIFEGEFLNAVITNRIVNDKLSSPVNAVVTRDLLDRRGKFVLIPATTKIVGTARKVSGQQDTRLFINFHRLILPNGRSLYFGKGKRRMSALDETGALGIKGKKNNHFFAKFGSSILYGSLNGVSGFAQNRIDQSSGLSRFLDRTSANFNTLNDRLASNSLAILPTITVSAGTRLKILITVDIDISAYSKISERSYYK